MTELDSVKYSNLSTANSVRRATFEEHVSCHLEALWRTALWLTKRRKLAEELLLKTLRRAYREWDDSGDFVSSKERLFRVLTSVLFEAGNPGHRDESLHARNVRTTAGSKVLDSLISESSIEPSQLPSLIGVSDISVRGAIARLRPQSRLMMILLYLERFSYAEIAYITDLPMDSVKATLTRLRRLIPRYLVRYASYFNETTAPCTRGGSSPIISE